MTKSKLTAVAIASGIALGSLTGCFGGASSTTPLSPPAPPPPPPPPAEAMVGGSAVKGILQFASVTAWQFVEGSWVEHGAVVDAEGNPVKTDSTGMVPAGARIVGEDDTPINGAYALQFTADSSSVMRCDAATCAKGTVNFGGLVTGEYVDGLNMYTVVCPDSSSTNVAGSQANTLSSIAFAAYAAGYLNNGLAPCTPEMNQFVTTFTLDLMGIDSTDAANAGIVDIFDVELKDATELDSNDSQEIATLSAVNASFGDSSEQDDSLGVSESVAKAFAVASAIVAEQDTVTIDGETVSITEAVTEVRTEVTESLVEVVQVIQENNPGTVVQIDDNVVDITAPTPVCTDTGCEATGSGSGSGSGGSGSGSGTS